MHMHYLKRTIDLAKQGRTSPNPMVGCVIVRDGDVVGEGYHTKAGSDHAEIVALKDAGKKARDATMYVSLEPCCTTGRTGPCTSAILKAGISKVVIGCLDVNPDVFGRGVEELTNKGVDVVVKDLKDVHELNEVYETHTLHKRPFVILKVGCSLDGKIATQSGESKYITGKESLEYVHELRDTYDAIMVSSSTVVHDNPQLTCRLNKEKKGRNPIRVIIDSKLRIPLTANVLKDGHFIVATTSLGSKSKIDDLRRRGGQVIIIPHKDGMIDLRRMMEELAKLDVTSIIVEGGPLLNSSLLRERLVDKCMYFIAPTILGGPHTSVGDIGATLLSDALTLERVSSRMFGNDVLIEGYVKYLERDKDAQLKH